LFPSTPTVTDHLGRLLLVTLEPSRIRAVLVRVVAFKLDSAQLSQLRCPCGVMLEFRCDARERITLYIEIGQAAYSSPPPEF